MRVRNDSSNQFRLMAIGCIMQLWRIGCAHLGAPAGKPLPVQTRATQAAVPAAVFEPNGLNSFPIRRISMFIVEQDKELECHLKHGHTSLLG